MKKSWQTIAISAAGLLSVFVLTGAAPSATQPQFSYAADGQLKFPADYREWIFLSSGLGMTYGPVGDAGRMGPPMFDNVFVNPNSYREFLKTGHWPDRTIFVLEVRSSESHASINNDGHFQTGTMGIEAEVKDSSAKAGEWTFYGFGDPKDRATAVAKPVARTASCYTCHGKNTAVENTFVQFYPVLYDVAQAKRTLNAGFKELPITSGRLMELIGERGWSAGAVALDAVMAHSPGAAVLDPGAIRHVAMMLQPSHPKDAASLLAWAAAKHPGMTLLQADLTDAYAAVGDKDAARAAAKLVLDLAPRDPSLSAGEREDLTKAAVRMLR